MDQYNLNLLTKFAEFSSIDKKKVNEFLKKYKYNDNNDNDNDNDNNIIIYTDGACSSNGKLNAKGGIGVYFSNTKEYVSENIDTIILSLLPELQNQNVKPTNQKAELLAILKALSLSEQYMKKNKKIIIKTDSMYSINIFTKWYKTWEKNNWKTANGKNVLNKEIIEKILYYVKKNNINFCYVPAHKSQPSDQSKYEDWYGNKKADELAVQAIC